MAAMRERGALECRAKRRLVAALLTLSAFPARAADAEEPGLPHELARAAEIYEWAADGGLGRQLAAPRPHVSTRSIVLVSPNSRVRGDISLSTQKSEE